MIICFLKAMIIRFLKIKIIRFLDNQLLPRIETGCRNTYVGR